MNAQYLPFKRLFNGPKQLTNFVDFNSQGWKRRDCDQSGTFHVPAIESRSRIADWHECLALKLR